MWDKLRTLGRLLKRTVTGYLDDGCPNLSAAISYHALLSIIPMIFLALWALGFVMPSTDRAAALLDEQLRTFIPTLGAERMNQARAMLAQSGKFGLVGFLSVLLTAPMMMSATSYALDKVMLKQGKRRFIRSRLTSLLMVLLLGVSALFSIFVSAILNFIRGAQRWITDRTVDWIAQPLSWGYNLAESFLVGRVLPYLIMAFAFTTLYRTLTQARVPWRYAAVGGLLCAALFEAAKFGFEMYVVGVARYSWMYGSLGSLIVTLLWIYYSANVLLLCAEFIQALLEEEILGEVPER